MCDEFPISSVAPTVVDFHVELSDIRSEVVDKRRFAQKQKYLSEQLAVNP